MDDRQIKRGEPCNPVGQIASMFPPLVADMNKCRVEQAQMCIDATEMLAQIALKLTALRIDGLVLLYRHLNADIPLASLVPEPNAVDWL